MTLGNAARRFVLRAAWCLAAAAAPAAADVIDGEFTLGGRGISGDTHSGKFQEYRDLRPGVFGDGHFLIESRNQRVFLWGDFDNIGYDDQRYRLEAGEWGKLRLYGEYSELPHVFSTRTRTLYSYSGPNQLLLPDALQAAIEASAPDEAAQSALLGAGLAGARRTSLEYRLRTLVGGLVLDVREDLQFEAAYRQLDRSGRKPLSLGFGNPGDTFTSFASPVDESTDEITADIRWGRGPFHLEVGYLGSFYGNDLNQVTADNPLRLTNSPAVTNPFTGQITSEPGEGSISLAPDNSLNQFHATGTYELPLDMPARIAATLSYGRREQDDDFLAHTINPELSGNPLLVLPQDDLDGKVETYLANVLLTARPLPDLDLRARYRYYDYHNDTPVLDFPANVESETFFRPELRRNVPNDYERQEASADVSYRFSRAVRLRGGPFWERWSRSRDREVSKLDEYGGKLALDLRPSRRAVVRLDYLFGTRNGSSYNPYDFLAATLDPSEVEDAIPTSQLAGLRKFDEADRTRNEIRMLAQLTPREDLDLALSGGWAKYDYRNTDYGLKGSQRWNVGAELGFQPLEWLTISTWYDLERIQQDQRSRWRPRSFVPPITVISDPVNDWSSESTDTIHTIGARLGIVLIPDKLDLDFSYIFERGNGETHARSAAGCVGVNAVGIVQTCPPAADGGNAPNYPDLEDRLQIFTTVLRYHWNEHVTLEGMYAFEKLSLSNYRLDGLDPYMPTSNVDGSGGVSPSLDVFLGNRLGDYSAHVFAVSATYSF
jgi:MtrB/PioB family decaheme-associated outer membrane protein